MKCSFCATGAMSKANLRNLTSGEIVEQVLQVALTNRARALFLAPVFLFVS